MALNIGRLRSSALQNDGPNAPVILQCRAPQETNPKGHCGPNYVFIRYCFFGFLPVPSLGIPSLTLSRRSPSIDSSMLVDRRSLLRCQAPTDGQAHSFQHPHEVAQEGYASLPPTLEIVRLGIPRLGTWRKQKTRI